MAGERQDKASVKYVGDSRIPVRREKRLPKPYSEYPGKTEPFFPNFLLKEWMAAVVFLVGFMALVISHPAPLEPHAADPNDTTYTPMPDWYFLFLYQLLKYIPGSMIVLGTVIIPGIFSLLLLLAPWLDRSPERRPSRRPVATALMLFVVASIVVLTYQAVASHKAQQAEAAAATPPPPPPPAAEGAAFDPEQAFIASCASCHGQDLKGTPAAPSLVGLNLSVDEVVDIITNGRKGSMGVMPPGMFQGTDEQKKQLAEWVLSHQ
ncbi:c-type cytochrome [Hydrogenibacillus schlegelii]|uniref:Menaquinone-cytochrome C oxidoreductase, cytochrome C subunit n=1 Tax=Hydrogenibacillus schlegelii TaxID=1484 RepID=A0A2T5G887_HYDSH|nr:menaquinol-cytochrome c reductase cytochrome b/c subunit [Hydrogenibacillus schlegelii]PTQ52368.1 MAG: Menaquinone-cytochrome C oxidoreductase, cytochrome C subunit [Hydrogenibacillus schlegelii]